MRRPLVILSLLCLAAVSSLTACEESPVAQFWRPISEPNLLMPQDQLQTKLTFDLNQCHCGTYPANATRDEMVKFSPDKQRLVETGVTITPDEEGECLQQPSLVVTECMRQRGWEPTNCSGRMPLPTGGALCTAYHPDEGE
ncbi:MAG: hypothetical protein KGI37_06830 [Alphaproteobacteria bacterium]|nr:hypothetical protein [Alphaproteobacteria bacterium]